MINRYPAPNPAFIEYHHPTTIAPRSTKSERIEAAIAAIWQGEFVNYANAAAKYKCDYTMLLKRIWGLTKSKKDANSFSTNVLLSSKKRF